mmetsp:Transcript_11642/g.28695  ORF Transcript_11642/g.28695 Transcript_11642/m.28695 type:complete len:450 (-) Transcript_11642:36-1385(-)
MLECPPGGRNPKASDDGGTAGELPQVLDAVKISEGLLRLPPVELRLDVTLGSGQCFTWKKIAGGSWAGIVEDKYLVTLKETRDDIHFRFFIPLRANCRKEVELAPSPQITAEHAKKAYVALQNFFNLDVERVKLHEEWVAKGDPHLASRAQAYPGTRVIRSSNLLECVIGFVGSCWNTIKRNSKMMWNLVSMVDGTREANGCYMGTVAGHRFFRFPTLGQLAKLHPKTLRGLGWGYRASTVKSVCKFLERNNGLWWLERLRTMTTENARRFLQALPGVGPKVADCVLLFGLSRFEAIPIDTHAWQLVRRFYLKSLAKNAGLSAHYIKAVIALRRRLGRKPGWAFMVLFVGELADFRILPECRRAQTSKFFPSSGNTKNERPPRPVVDSKMMKGRKKIKKRCSSRYFPPSSQREKRCRPRNGIMDTPNSNVRRSKRHRRYSATDISYIKV